MWWVRRRGRYDLVLEKIAHCDDAKGKMANMTRVMHICNYAFLRNTNLD